ncbi:vinorine synthase-like [Abrus precatorius]|uniref:Vinorine synthase-like n=1 Tax=Abrus precatorius TaxID=3816 RepID=A0A8B8K017_ABRPR|nr:vinorine synthase-like [Abrus precatorius]
MVVKGELVSKDTIKPSSPTPDHLRNFKISLLDQLAPPSFYVPILLFYSAPDVTAFGINFKTISNKLKASLSTILTLYYPFCGRLKGNSSVECNDEGVLFVEYKFSTELSNILKSPQLHEINELFPFDPYNPPAEHNENMAIQLNEFRCGGIALGVCFSHKIADGSTAASFLNAWASTSKGQGNNIVAPAQLEEATQLFPPRNIEMDMTRGLVGHKNLVTKRLVFYESDISRLKQKLGCFNFNPTRVEAVTALIWKSSLEAAKATSGEQKCPASIMVHAVNIRSRMAPTLSKHSIGNLWQPAVSSLVEVSGEIRLHDLAEIVRKTIRKVDGDYISKLQGAEFFKVINSLESWVMAAEKGIPCHGFSSWIKFEFYEADFGWGKPTYVRTIGVPIKNVVILMATKDGDGIEAWVTLTTRDMLEFERNPQLLEFSSLDFN